MLFLIIVPVDYLAWVFLRPIRVLVFITIVGNINGVDSRGWDRAFSSLISVLVIAVLFLLFSALGNRLRGPKVGRLKILVLRVKALDLWISYRGSMGRRFSIFVGLLVISNLLVHLLEY